jgi:Leucine-rich repeat (LRR) protein
MGYCCSKDNENSSKHKTSKLRSFLGNDIILQKILTASKTLNYNFDNMDLKDLEFLNEYEKIISDNDEKDDVNDNENINKNININRNKLKALKSNKDKEKEKENKSIKVFSANNNKIRYFPKEFFKARKKVIKIDLSFNDLISIDPCICEIETIKFIILNNNKISSIPNNFVSMKQLKELNLANNLIISEEISNKLYDLDNIESINLSGNKIKNFPIDILKNKNLSYLNISNNLIENDIQNKYWEFSNLDNLDLSFNKLNIGNICKEIMKISKISNLNLKGNLIKIEELKTIDGFDLFYERRKQRKNQGFIHNLDINFDFCGLD